MAHDIYSVLKDKGPKGPKKEIKSITHTKTHNGKHVMTHKHHAPFDGEKHDETHMMNNMSDVHSHNEAHAGTPAPGEAAATPGVPQLTASASPEPPPAAGAGAPPPAGM
jgi:hypothetical protein